MFLEDGAAPPRLQHSDLPRFLPRERVQYVLLWLHPGRAPQSVSLTFDGKVAWAEVGGNVSGPVNGKWERLHDDDGQYMTIDFHAFGEETRLRSTVFQPVAQDSCAWHAVGTVEPNGALHFLAPHELATWHVLALFAMVPMKRPAV